MSSYFSSRCVAQIPFNVDIPLQKNKLIALFLTLCLLQCVFTSPVSPSVRQDLLELLRSRERRYSQQLDPELDTPVDTDNTLKLNKDRLLKRANGTPIALNPGILLWDILRSGLDNDRRRQQMSELADVAARNSELFTRVGRR